MSRYILYNIMRWDKNGTRDPLASARIDMKFVFSFNPPQCRWNADGSGGNKLHLPRVVAPGTWVVVAEFSGYMRGTCIRGKPCSRDTANAFAPPPALYMQTRASSYYFPYRITTPPVVVRTRDSWALYLSCTSFFRSSSFHRCLRARSPPPQRSTCFPSDYFFLVSSSG